jgi:hypothetical protein
MSDLTIVRVGGMERHVMPSGVEVWYRDRDHSYWRGAKENKAGEWSGTGRLTGVSSVVAPWDWRPDNLMRWAARQNGAGIATLAAEGLSLEDADDMRAALSFLKTGEHVWQALEDARLLYSDRSEDAATRGTNVHKHSLQALATGVTVPDRTRMTDEEWGYALGVMAFWVDCDPVTDLAEAVVCDPDLGVAGRLDFVGTITYRGMRVRALVDAKTSGFIPTKHHVQLAGYEHCAQVCGHDRTDVQLILQVAEDGTYNLLPSCATARDFTTGVDLYRRAARIGRDFNAVRKLEAAA